MADVPMACTAAVPPPTVALYRVDGQAWVLHSQGALHVEFNTSAQAPFLVIRELQNSTVASEHPILGTVFDATEQSLCWEDRYLNTRVALSFQPPETRDLFFRACQTVQETYAALRDHPNGLDFWYRSFLDAGAVPWPRFLAALAATLQRDLTSRSHDLQYALGVTSQTDVVTPPQFSVFLAWFSPLYRCVEEVSERLDQLRNVISIQWFHGFITRSESERRLRGKARGTFLVRFSSMRNNYALSYVSHQTDPTHTLVETLPNGKVSIQTTTGEALQYDNLIDLVQREGRNLYYPCIRPGQEHAMPALAADDLVQMSNSNNFTDQAAARQALADIVIGTQQQRDPSAAADDDIDLTDLVCPLWEIPSSELTLGKCIGEGTFGQVFLGTWRDDRVAIKQLKCQSLTPQVVQEFKKEVDIMSNLADPYIVQFMGACSERQHLAMVTEFMSHGSLHSVLHKRLPDRSFEFELPWPLRVRMAADAAFGMAYLHSVGLIHRDLKSLNLLVNDEWRCKVADFGLSRVKTETKKMTGEIGSTLWMAPELFYGKSINYDESIDVYSFGIVMWEILMREEPFSDIENQVAIAVFVAFKKERPPVPADAPADYVQLMRECWDHEPKKRPKFSEVARRLTEMHQRLTS